ncbi:MAG: antitoxin [Acidobacteria bacterium]|nr:antitoxin [Acidobacteriota bacterium]
MRTTISIDDPLLNAAKQRALERGVTLGGIVEDALRVYFATTDAAVARPFRLHTVSGRLVNRNVDLDRTSALVTQDDEQAYSKAYAKTKRRR